MTAHPSPGGSAGLTYPPAVRLELTEVVSGHLVADPYRWLEDRDDPRTQAWQEAEDTLAARALAGLADRARFTARVGALLAVGAVGPPTWRGARAFWSRRLPGQDHPALVWADLPDGGTASTVVPRTLVDPAERDPSGLTTLDGYEPSPDGQLVAVLLSRGGTEESELEVLEVATGQPRETGLDRVRYSPIAWLADSSGFCYVRRQPPGSVPAGEEQFHRRVRLHRLGTDFETDPILFGDHRAPTSYYGLQASPDGRWLAISSREGTAPRTDVFLADLAGFARGETPPIRTLVAGRDARTEPWFGPDNRLYLATDAQAPRGRLCVVDPADPPADPAGWHELLGEAADAVLVGAVPTGAGLVVVQTVRGVATASVHDEQTGESLYALDLPGTGSVTVAPGHPDGGGRAWLGWTSYTEAPAVLEVEAATGAVRFWARPQAPELTTAVRVVEEVARSADGTPVAVTVLSAGPPAGDSDTRAPRPTILTGYGGFGIALTPGYAAAACAWVEAGGVYAVAHLRGGLEEGEAWHRAGMREHKGNVFADLHAVAELLISRGWTTAEQLGLRGGSNGGLLVGAALTQRPELYRAVVCSAPLLDMVRYERFGLGRTWNDEYGTAERPEELAWLLSYSPYHHVRPGTAYPAVLFTTFDGDTRVDPVHARKMCAALQHASTSGRPILLRTERGVGHGSRAVARTAALDGDVLAFLAAQLGGPGSG